MKKLIQFAALIFFTVVFLIACSKKDQLGPVNNPPPQTPEAPLTGQMFEELNDAIARFDPLYLQIVYKDNRTREEINNVGMQLLQQWNQAPTSVKIQKQLTELYHFDSFEALQKTSATIRNNANSIKINHFQNTKELTKDQIGQLAEARKNFIKTKISNLEKDTQKKSLSLWTDNAAWILDEFHYYTQVGNLEMGLDMDGATGNDCNEACCFEYVACQQAAKKDYIMNAVILSFMSGGALSSVSYRLTANNPILNPMSPIVGSMIGLSGSILLADQFYKLDLSNCVLKYKACIQRKNGN